MLGELLHLIRSLEKRAASAAVPDSIAHRLANPVASSPVNSIQRGTISLSAATSATATITSVNTAKAVELNCGAEVTLPAGAGERSAPSLELTNATTVTARTGELTSATVRYVVLEYK